MKHQSNILALKYRPSNFQDLIGQEYLVETIQKSIEQNKTPNAYIFTGIRGVGKTTTARIVAKMLNCTVFDKNNKPDLTNCEQAKAITEDRHPDVIEIDAASNTSVENAREISNLHIPFSAKCEESSHLQAKKCHFCPTNCEDSHVFI